MRATASLRGVHVKLPVRRLRRPVTWRELALGMPSAGVGAPGGAKSADQSLAQGQALPLLPAGANATAASVVSNWKVNVS